MRRLLIALLLATATGASAQVPTPCGAATQVCATTTDLTWAPEDFTVEGSRTIEVTLRYTHVPGPAAALAEEPTRLRFTALPGPQVSVDPDLALFQAPIEGAATTQAQVVEFTFPLTLRCGAPEGQVRLHAAAEANGWFMESEDTEDLAFDCTAPLAPSAAPAAVDPAGSPRERPGESAETAPADGRAIPSVPLALLLGLVAAAALAGRRL